MKKLLVVLTLCLAFAPMAARADSVRVDHMGQYFLTGHIDTGTNAWYPNLHGDFYVGQIEIKWNDKPYTGYCVDLFSSFNLGNWWEADAEQMNTLPTTEGPFRNSPYATAGTGGHAAWLANTVVPATSQEGAALQLAIWLTLYSDLKTEWFYFGSNDEDVKDLASDWFEEGLKHSTNAVWLDADQIRYPHSQDFVVRTATPVPEPASMLLFGTGLIGLAGVARRRFRK